LKKEPPSYSEPKVVTPEEWKQRYFLELYLNEKLCTFTMDSGFLTEKPALSISIWEHCGLWEDVILPYFEQCAEEWDAIVEYTIDTDGSIKVWFETWK
jgi:hypothetical protein